MYICEVLFLLRLFIFPLLAVSVVVCPIIYLFVGVVCVLANSFTNSFNMFLYANIKSMLTNSV